jgi:hypothetical protein
MGSNIADKSVLFDLKFTFGAGDVSGNFAENIVSKSTSTPFILTV